MVNNPFVIAGKIPGKYFCDRETETKKLISLLQNGNNVTLISPRRMGKSGLILHCFDQTQIKENYATLYIDILQTSSLKEFVFILGKAVYDNLVPKTQKWISNFFQTIKSLTGKISLDPTTGLPSFNFFIGEITSPEMALEEIFKFLENYAQRCIIAIDEFQQVTKYPEGNLEAVLRARIQLCSNLNFIFSGSERHIMQDMFLNYGRPFFNSTTIMMLEAIPFEIYWDFVKLNFNKSNKEIEKESFAYLYDLFQGYTYYLQKTLNETYSKINDGEKCSLTFIKKMIDEILESNSTTYREILSNIPHRQKDLLYAIALEGEADGITSSSFIRKYNLVSAASVQSATNKLLNKDFITRAERKYFLTDKFMALWIRKIYG